MGFVDKFVACSPLSVGYQIFSDATSVPSQYHHLVTRLRIEQTRLLIWGEQIGLLELSPQRTSKDLRLDLNLVNNILLEIQATFRGCVEIQAKFEPFVESALVLPQTEQSQQRPSTRKALLERVLNICERSTRAATRLQWAMIKKESFEKLVDKQIMFNDRVESLLDRNTLGDLHAMQVQSNLMLLQVTDEVAQLRLLVKALDIAQTPIERSKHRDLGDKESADERRTEGTVASLARFKAEALLVDQDMSQQIPTRIELESIELDNSDSSTSRWVGRYAGHRIWLEWREQVAEAQYSAKTQQIVERRVKQLATLLSLKHKSSLFNAPSCLGYTRDDKDGNCRHALAYKVEIPPDSRFVGVYTLRDALDRRPIPSLAERFAVASALADSLFYLHAVSWLHKGIRSDNVLFVHHKSKAAGLQTHNSSPILSGFDYSRPDLIDEQSFHNTRTPSHDLYCHPDLLRFRTKRSRKCHDMYSLGLILIENALWRPIEDIVGIEVRRSRLLEVAHTVAKLNEKGNALRSELLARVGELYTEVVNSCMSNVFGDGAAAGSQEDDPEIAGEIQELFFENVVQKLRRLSV